MHQKNREVWYLLEEGVDYIGAMSNGKPAKSDEDCIYSGDSLSDMLHKIQDAGDSRFYSVLSYISSQNSTKDKDYPHHRELHILAGFVPEVCDIRFNDRHYTREWTVDYVRELWVKTSPEKLVCIRNYTEKADKAARNYIKEHGLRFEKND